ncbi:fungal-specific transcription factor domain-containing protein [Astrocystis sublimbata]|nr:fungal-specific transcription factor domain-containing protein [Astrocystis sublimbata]
MDLNATSGAGKTSHRSFNGCWTCRLRRKKCDEQHPVCDGCDALNLTCYYDQEKPSWMDGGARQEEMAEYLKRKVKERGHRRFVNVAPIAKTGPTYQPPSLEPVDTLNTSLAARGTAGESFPPSFNSDSPRRASCKFAYPVARRHESDPSQFADTVLVMFYIEHVSPFLFPFYQPPLLQGGRAWVLDMMTNSPVVRRAALCQSSYFSSLSRGVVDHDDPPWNTVLTQTREAFEVLRQALQVISGSNIVEHLHGAVRVLLGIIQVQRFEIAISSFENCHFHLKAALALFKRILESAQDFDALRFHSSFEAVMYNLSPLPWNRTLNEHLPSAEQAAFRFSSALLVFDDIVASTVLQEQPKLYELHSSLLSDNRDTGPAIDLEAVVGCQNWALIQVAEIAVLDAWKQQCKRSGTLDVMELVRRATPIKATLETRLAMIETMGKVDSSREMGICELFSPQQTMIAAQKSLVTIAWGHAALIYLSVVVSGWQPASAEIRLHVRRIIEGPITDITPSAMLRTIIWPLSVAGCLAEPDLATQLRTIIERLQPRSVFGTITKALSVMTNVWRSGEPQDFAHRDFASCFRTQGDLMLLV